MNYLEMLTALQQTIGYSKGNVSPVALLGLCGEAGEVLAETKLISTLAPVERIRQKTVLHALIIDQLKKELRDNKLLNVTVHLSPGSEEKFDLELSDLFYYVNAIAINRGLTIDDLAKLSYNKVIGKMVNLK